MLWSAIMSIRQEIVFFQAHRPARLLIQEAAAKALSRDPLVRTVIDEKLGTLLLGRARPQDEGDEYYAKIETGDRTRTVAILNRLTGIRVIEL
jgi:hypothetical protein